MGALRTLKFSESGVRGVVGESLTPRLVLELAAAFGSYLGGGDVAVGRDTRSSGAALNRALCAGLASVGCQVIDLGVAPTPTMQFMTRKLGASGAVVLTASHNPMDWNALKFIGRSGTFLDRQEAAELFDIYTQGAFDYKPEDRLLKKRFLTDGFEEHKKSIFSRIDVERIRSRHFRVAVDCVNGVGAVYTVPFLRELGCEVVAVNDRPDGKFGRMPEPLPENLGALSGLVKRGAFDIGFAQDPDGDRLTLVDEKGNALSPHLTVALAVEHVLSKNPGGEKVVVNIQTTRIVEDLADEYDGELFYAKVGEINVVEKMLEVGASIGGEGNCGGVIYPAVNRGRDSFCAMALLLESLAERGTSLGEHLRTMPLIWQYNGRFPMGPAAAREVIAQLKKHFASEKITDFDGLRIDFDAGWVLLRSSNTENILRLQIESEAEDAMEMFRDKFTGLLKQLAAEAGDPPSRSGAEETERT